jgi:hypothetical protein
MRGARDWRERGEYWSMVPVYSTRAIGVGKDNRRIGRRSRPVLEEVSMHRRLFLALPAFAYLMVACDRPADVTSPSLAHGDHAAPSRNVALSGEVQRDIARLRDLTAPFHEFEAAARAGWGAQITGCFSDPTLGGMGYHYGNVDLIDGTVAVLEPELLLYEPQKNGKLRLVAVEYIVPFGAWTATEPPRLFDQSFHRNEAFGLWVLHVWHFRNNPNGMFADWNPTVSCEFAP